MGNPKKFIDDVLAFKGESIEDWKLEAMKPLLAESYFNFESMKSKSTAAAFLCKWIVNIVEFNRIYKIVAPLKEAADTA